MADATVYTALNIPAAPAQPSDSCLQWNAAGQACFVMKGAVYILTPEQGITFDTASAVKSQGAIVQSNSFGWFRAMFELDLSVSENGSRILNWTEQSLEWGVTSLGSMDVSMRMISCSPFGVTSDAGCVIAALTSNMELDLWAPSKNCLRGEWLKIFNFNAFLLSEDLGYLSASRSLAAQITWASWSAQANFDVSPAYCNDGSILALGNRAGALVFFRYRSEDGSGDRPVALIKAIKVSRQWITQIAWSAWHSVESRKCHSLVACATADGCVRTLACSQTLSENSSELTGLNAISTSFEDALVTLVQPDGRCITSLTWVELGVTCSILVWCKPGAVHLWAPDNPAIKWCGTRQLHFRSQKQSLGSSALHPVSGISYDRRHDALIITLFDGSVHAIHSLVSEPTWDPRIQGAIAITSQTLTKAARNAFQQAERDKVVYADVNFISGMKPFDDFSAFLWVHESSRPSDFSYKHEAKHNSMLVVARLGDDPSPENILEGLADTLDHARCASACSPLHYLRSYIMNLKIVDKHSSLYPRWPMVIAMFSSMLALRLRFAFASYYQRSLLDQDMQVQHTQAVQLLHNELTRRFLRTLLRHLRPAIKWLSNEDVPFALRVIVQCLLDGTPEDLKTEARQLQDELDRVLPDFTTTQQPFKEQCPACEGEIQLLNLSTARCVNSHTWGRCSITSFVISTPLIRTCIGCSRKTFMPRSMLSKHPMAGSYMLPDAARSWVVEELLEAVHRCPYCGNLFVSVL